MPSINPMFGAPAPMRPLAPIKNGQNTQAQPDLPALNNPEEMEFFQPGALLGNEFDSDTEQERDAQTQGEPEAMAEEPTTRPAVRQRSHTLNRRFNYKIQNLPQAIYNKSYSPQNRHLPPAHYTGDYEHATFMAAAQNNLNGLRAMIEHGRQSLAMRNLSGQTLVDIALHYGAHDTLRYLIAKGAPRGNAMATDPQAYYALRTGQ